MIYFQFFAKFVANIIKSRKSSISINVFYCSLKLSILQRQHSLKAAMLDVLLWHAPTPNWDAPSLLWFTTEFGNNHFPTFFTPEANGAAMSTFSPTFLRLGTHADLPDLPFSNFLD